MHLNNIALLTSLALLSTANAYDVLRWDSTAHNLVQRDNLDLDTSLGNVIAHFINNGEWPEHGPLNTVLGFKKARGLFDVVDQAKIIAFAQTPNRPIMKKLSKAHIQNIVNLFKPTPAAGAPGLTLTDTTCNTCIAAILENSDPKNWPNDMEEELINSLDGFFSTVAQIRKLNPTLIKKKPGNIMSVLLKSAHYYPVLATKSILKQLLKSTAACSQVTPELFKYLARNPGAAKSIDSKAFADMGLVHSDPTCGRYIRFLPNNIFEHVSVVLPEEFIKHATPDQIKNWQAKNIKNSASFLQIYLLNRHQSEVLPVKVYMKFFEEAKTDAAKRNNIKYWSFWKHLPTKVLKELLDELNIATIVPAEAFKQMTVAQRQLILDAGDKDKGTDCSMLPVTILKGKKKRVTGLHASKKCFESLGDSGSWIFRALVLDMFDGKLGRKLSAGAVAQFSTKLRRAKKANADGKLTSRPDLELDGVLALEALQHKQKGPEFVKSFFDHKDKDVLETVCKGINSADLRKTKWLQTMMSKACIKHIAIDLDDAKRLHPNIWANFSKEQIKSLVGDRTDLKELDGPFMEGLAANKHFAARSCKKRTKENKHGDDVDRKAELALVKPSVRSKYFGSKYIKALPDDKDCMATVAAHVASLADDAMAGVTAAWVSKNKNVVDNLRPEQFGRISDDLDSETYPAALNAANVMGLSNDKVSNLSAKFLSHMTPSGLSYFSAEQVKLIPADSLTLLCGDKAKAIKHELSESQKAALGKDCPATEGSMAPTNAHIGAFTAAAALAAGSLALLI